jgi:hypothetical protein
MKRLLLFFFCAGFVCFGKDAYAQNNCTIDQLSFNLTITNTITNPDGTCQVTANLSVNAKFNGGAKNLYIHLWEEAPINKYPNPPINYAPDPITGAKANPPTASQLQNGLGTIIIENPGANNPSQVSLGNSYFGTSAKVLTAQTFARTGTNPYTYQLNDVVFKISSCGGAFAIKGDIWGSNNSNNVQCSRPGVPVVSFNPRISGSIDCGSPRTFSVTINNTSSTVSITTNYTVYWDDGDGVFEPTAATNGATKDELVYTTPSTISVAAGGNNTVSSIPYPPYNAQNPDSKHNLYIVGTASTTGLRGASQPPTTTNYPIYTISNGCFFLPVIFSYFEAARSTANNAQVALMWETATEQNNKGFYLQRKTEGEWQDIGFVASAAKDGNSSTALQYSFKDLNTFTATSYYRMYQVDFDGRSDYSEVRAVAGATSPPGILVYPNPAHEGKTTLLFPDLSVRNIILSDANGRVVTQVRNWTGNTYSFEKLKPGFYTIKIISAQKGTADFKKLIVQ